jgi:membrane protein implicated in regulation of membrane protease activity
VYYIPVVVSMTSVLPNNPKDWKDWVQVTFKLWKIGSLSMTLYFSILWNHKTLLIFTALSLSLSLSLTHSFFLFFRHTLMLVSLWKRQKRNLLTKHRLFQTESKEEMSPLIT